MSGNPPRLSIVIVNWNTCELLRACLASLVRHPASGGTEIIVVDNSSADGSPEMVQKEYPEVRLFALTQNLGFGGANNLGLREASGRMLLILNSDTEVHEGALDTMCRILEEDPSVGAVGAQLLNSDGSVQLSCRRFPSYKTALFHRYSLMTRLFPRNRYSAEYLMTDAGHDRKLEPDWVSGACLMTRRDVTDKVGLLDEDFFMYAEDVDWCYRIRQAGYRILYEPQAQVTHHIGRTTRKVPYRMIFERHRSMWIFYRKHYSRGIVLLDVATLVGIALRCAALETQAFMKSVFGREARA